jgi:carbonic anhydrase
MKLNEKSMFSQSMGCACCADFLAKKFDRRHFLMASTAGLAAVALAPSLSFAGSGKYEAMVLSCIDPRFHEPVRNTMAARKLTGQYSQFVIAGASIGVVAPAFKDWQKTFWDNLGASIQLHAINRVIVINHRDCGAAKIAYGESAVKTPEVETKTHREALAEFRRQLKERHPDLGAETGLMALDGKIEALG